MLISPHPSYKSDLNNNTIKVRTSQSLEDLGLLAQIACLCRHGGLVSTNYTESSWGLRSLLILKTVNFFNTDFALNRIWKVGQVPVTWNGDCNLWLDKYLLGFRACKHWIALNIAEEVALTLLERFNVCQIRWGPVIFPTCSWLGMRFTSKFWLLWYCELGRRQQPLR